jgi:4-hydroxythreonine-4-phosphate dehydrogenase
MSELNKVKIGITQGDTNGVAYELILKTFEDERMLETCTPIVYGSAKALAYHRKALEITTVNTRTITNANDANGNQLYILNLNDEEIPIELGKSSPESIAAADVSLTKALADLRANIIDALVVAPAATSALPAIEKQLPNEQTGLKIWVNNSFRVALATDQVSLAEVSSLLTVEKLTEQIQALRDILIRDFAVTFPRIAVLALNPDLEMETVTKEAIKAASDSGVQCFGPYVADEYFATEKYQTFDATLAMYHDQGMIAFQTIANEENALLYGNLPYIITAPKQTANFAQAGKNAMTPDSLRQALYVAIDTFNARLFDAEINSNPLRKQYFERGSDNEKLDLTRED